MTFPGNIIRGQRALRGQQPVPISKPGQPKWTFNSRPTVTIGGGLPAPPSNLPLYPSNSLNLAFTSRPSTYDVTVSTFIVSTISCLEETLLVIIFSFSF